MPVRLDGRKLPNKGQAAGELRARGDMELFTMGVGRFAETVTCGGPAVHRLEYMVRKSATAPTAITRSTTLFLCSMRRLRRNSRSHSFTNGSKIICSRGRGWRAGRHRLVNAVARHPATGPRLARKLYAYFINQVDPPDEGLIADLARIYYENQFGSAVHAPVRQPVELLQALLLASGVRCARAALGWWAGFSVNQTARDPSRRRREARIAAAPW